MQWAPKYPRPCLKRGLQFSCSWFLIAFFFSHSSHVFNSSLSSCTYILCIASRCKWGNMNPEIQPQYLQPRHVVCSLFRQVKCPWHWFTYRSSLHKEGQNLIQCILQSSGRHGAKFEPRINRCCSSGFSVFELGAWCLPGRLLCIALCSCSRAVKGACPWVQRGGPGWEHLPPNCRQK